MTARTGDVIETREQLAALPVGAIVASGPWADRGFIAATRAAPEEGWEDYDWEVTGQSGRHSHEGVREVLGRATVLYVPGEQPRTSDDVVEQAARVIREATDSGADRTEDYAHALADAGLLVRPVSGGVLDETEQVVYAVLAHDPDQGSRHGGPDLAGLAEEVAHELAGYGLLVGSKPSWDDIGDAAWSVMNPEHPHLPDELRGVALAALIADAVLELIDGDAR